MNSKFLAFSLVVVGVFALLSIASLTFAPGLAGESVYLLDNEGNIVGMAAKSNPTIKDYDDCIKAGNPPSECIKLIDPTAGRR